MHPVTPTNALFRELIARKGYPEAEPGKLHLIGLRGAQLDASGRIVRVENRVNEYDDLVGYFGTQLQLYQATVDPGQYYRDHPLNPDGCAHLKDGAYRYVRGLHHGRIPCLVQGAAVEIWRDKDLDPHWKRQDPVRRGEFGIHIHPGGDDEAIGKWSAGCQVLPREEWPRFWEVVNRAPQNAFRYYLFDSNELFA